MAVQNHLMTGGFLSAVRNLFITSSLNRIQHSLDTKAKQERVIEYCTLFALTNDLELVDIIMITLE